MGLAPLWYRQPVNACKMLGDCSHVGVVHGVNGSRPIFDRSLARLSVRIKRIEKLPKRRVKLLFAGFHPTDHLAQRTWFFAEQIHGRRDASVRLTSAVVNVQV